MFILTGNIEQHAVVYPVVFGRRRPFKAGFMQRLDAAKGKRDGRVFLVQPELVNPESLLTALCKKHFEKRFLLTFYE